MAWVQSLVWEHLPAVSGRKRKRKKTLGNDWCTKNRDSLERSWERFLEEKPLEMGFKG